MEQAAVCPPKSRSDLEWDRVLAALSERAQSALGRRACLALPFAPDRASALDALEEVKEAALLDVFGEPLSVGSLPDTDEALDRARIGAPLSGDELCAVLGVLRAGRALRSFLKARRDRAPRLASACHVDPSLDALEKKLDTAFEPDGSVSDRASPALASLRAERRAARDRLLRKLDELIQKHADLLQDGYFTERDGRYVLPVRADAHERLQGIVHGESASGATVFVEPRAIEPLGNRLILLDAQIDRAIQVVLAALSAAVAEAVPAVVEAVAALARADVRGAAARLAQDLRLSFPDVAPEGEPSIISLRDARHPLLLLDRVEVIASDLYASEGEAVVVSGPNAGGKTVALKTLGLAALMLRAGLPVPARDGSRLSVFDAVLTDVGDDQSLHKNLSTFSAHIKNLAAILDATRPGALVLLDEVCGGTDPREGEALAAALLDSMASRGGAIVCTTHYEGLKVLALKDGRFKNASVGFEMSTMSPTFRLVMGVPGPSSALSVARRFGVPAPVVERAGSFLSRQEVAFEEVVGKLAAERRELDLVRAEVLREAEDLRSRRSALDAERERLLSKEKGAISEQGRELLEELGRARAALRAAELRLKARPSEADLREASRAIDSVAQKVAIGGELSLPADDPSALRPRVAPGSLKVGSRVYVPKLRADADVIEVLASGMVRVAAGPLKLTARSEELRAPTVSEAASPKIKQNKSAKSAKKIDFDAAADPDVPIQTGENTVDLRGLRAHEATAMAEQFLDRMMGAGKRVAFLIHGHGTGALRDAVRETVRLCRGVERSRPGEQREGGDGVTVVWLR